MALLFESLTQYKSSIYETARGLLVSRNRKAKAIEIQKKRIEQLQSRLEQRDKALRECRQELEDTRGELEAVKLDYQALQEKPVQLPSDLPLPHHSFGPKLIALCLNLSKVLGFRPTETALTMIFEFLQITDKVPSSDAIRIWACRAGVASLAQFPEWADDWIWMVDHSNQIGKEKVLVILGIRASQLPPDGKTLRREDMIPLAVIPGKNWKSEDVAREYEKLAKEFGPPRYLLTDGAPELFDCLDSLEKDGKKVIVLRDIKHYAANVFEKLIGKDERFTQYLSAVGLTRSRVQQTELGHFTPPPQKSKARFMNMGPLLRWGQMVSYHLSTPHSKAREEVSASRMNEKLGWVRDYRPDLLVWNRVHDVMQTSLRFMNTHALEVGTYKKLKKELRKLMATWPDCELSNQMATSMIEFVKSSGAQLEPGERTWSSTENLESTFGSFKGIEGQHSKGGFTSLISALPIIFTNWTADHVRESFSSVSVSDMHTWVKKNLGTTLASRRATAYHEFTTNAAVSA